MRHLVVIVHGLGGMRLPLRQLQKQIDRGLMHRADVVMPKCNTKLLGTYDGVDLGGHRLAAEVVDIASRHPYDTVSFIGHSLGGLYARFAIGLLHRKGFFSMVRPHAFVTLASPHLGTARPASASHGFLRAVTRLVSENLLSDTGDQLSLTDEYGPSKVPLLLAMTDPCSPWMHALRLFPRISFYANARGDFRVSCTSSAVVGLNPYGLSAGKRVAHLPDWRHIVADVAPHAEQILPGARWPQGEGPQSLGDPFAAVRRRRSSSNGSLDGDAFNNNDDDNDKQDLATDPAGAQVDDGDIASYPPVLLGDLITREDLFFRGNPRRDTILAMLRNLSSLPLRRVFCMFPSVFQHENITGIDVLGAQGSAVIEHVVALMRDGIVPPEGGGGEDGGDGNVGGMGEGEDAGGAASDVNKTSTTTTVPSPLRKEEK